MILNRILVFLLCFSFLSTTVFAVGTAKGSNAMTIQWTTDFSEATALAKQTGRPLLLFFTGSDWCGWCTKLEKEVLENREFIGAASNKFIFVKLDYPMKKKLDPQTTKQNEELQKRFAVRSFPTVMLLDSEQQPIGTTGYRAGGGKQYASHLMKMVDEFVAYKEQMKLLGVQKFSGKELKRLYQKAGEFGLKKDQSSLITAGVESDLPHFFLTERYRELVDSKKGASQEAQAVKLRLHSLDPDNTHYSHYQLAMIDFASKNRDNLSSSEEAIAPLLTYINTFGDKDREHLWRLHLEIYQIYLDNNQLERANKHARLAHDFAPASIRPELAFSLETIEKKLNSNSLN